MSKSDCDLTVEQHAAVILAVLLRGEVNFHCEGTYQGLVEAAEAMRAGRGYAVHHPSPQATQAGIQAKYDAEAMTQNRAGKGN